LVEEEQQDDIQLNNFGIGIDLGIKEFAICSNNTNYKNINKTGKIKKLEKKLKREQRKLSRKYESLKQKNKKGKEFATRHNIQKQVLTVQKIHHTLDNIRTDYINKVVNDLVKTKPNYITIEDLNVSGMMKNKHLSKAVAQQKFYEFRKKLENKCKQFGIELRIVDRFYPSSKLCHACGCIKSDLKLSDREYICECGYHVDRDYNASLNLRDAKIYKIA
jgi:putative transposase